MTRIVCILLLLSMTLNVTTGWYQAFISNDLSSIAIFDGKNLESEENEESKSEFSDNEEDIKYHHTDIVSIVIPFDTFYFAFLHRDEFLSLSFVSKLIDPPDFI